MDFSMPKEAARQLYVDSQLGYIKNLRKAGDEYGIEHPTMREQLIQSDLDFSDKYGSKLKAMKLNYLSLVDQNCYQPQHISDDFTNDEQIQLCR